MSYVGIIHRSVFMKYNFGKRDVRVKIDEFIIGIKM